VLINREIIKNINEELDKPISKVIVIYGPRQVGKTTLINTILDMRSESHIKINVEQSRYNEIFSSTDLQKMKAVIEDKEILFIDEAQVVENIGVNLKILHDALPNLKIVVTGSSSFEIANKMQEPLTGRIRTYNLYPLSISELRSVKSRFDLSESREEMLIYGLYPEVYIQETNRDKVELLLHLSSSYLYKDILQLTNIKHSDKLTKLAQLLALQIGSQVSINKLANALDTSSETVENYIDLLEKCFVLFRLNAYSKNKAKEISKSSKIYFYDLGIRNAVLNNFTPCDSRNDTGAMWENFLMAERMKKLSYDRRFVKPYFWRTYAGAEIDYIEEADGKLSAYEFKMSSKKGKIPTTWANTYGNEYMTVNVDNWLEWVM
jgi:hypothetical protein